MSRWCLCDCGLHGLRFVLTFSPSCLWKFWWSLDWSCWVSRTTNIILCRGWWLQIPLVSDTFEFLEFPEHLCIWWWTAVVDNGLYKAFNSSCKEMLHVKFPKSLDCCQDIGSGRSRTGNRSLEVSEPEALWSCGLSFSETWRFFEYLVVFWRPC